MALKAFCPQTNKASVLRDDPIIYKLLFRVAPPPKDSTGRIGPRFLWSLVSLSRRNTVDQSASGSPIVTRLNIESFEFKHLALVIKVGSRGFCLVQIIKYHKGLEMQLFDSA
ncbi:unnamed protein product [Hydatigera taeniaeformis]|uniref:Uncharacterized protein n=1 Tax=Hydatigena taeniaeformis TaxID=6205 RepID=A0A0R3WT01_HYDTA|nr:unnamed protein product [Hydatigera taeniaeformis]